MFGDFVWPSCVLALLLLVCPALATTYYVSPTGSNSHSGESPQAAWRDLEPVNATAFSPGDRILLAAGSRYTGQLKPQGSGAEGKPIAIDMYGKGAKPRIDGAGQVAATVLLYNVEYWEVSNLEITNSSADPKPHAKGVRVHIEDFGTAHHIHLRNLYVHDISGFGGHDDDGSGDGIYWLNEGRRVRSRFDGLVIEDCHVADTHLNGIWGWSAYTNRRRWYPSLNVVIRGNLLERIGLHGLVPIGCDGVLVEYNVLKGAGVRHQSCCGIWPWSCDNAVVQFNEVSGVRGVRDGYGFDSDWNSRNSIFQYNYSHDNEMGFMLVCTPRLRPGNVGCVGTVVRYNISENDGWGTRPALERRPSTFFFGGDCRDTYVYGNTIYIGPKLDIHLVEHEDWNGGWSEDSYFANNIFYAEGTARYDFGLSENNVFNTNLWFGKHTDRPDDPNAITDDPLLTKPGAGRAVGDARKLAGLDAYRLRKNSPAIDRGADLKSLFGLDMGKQDFYGAPIPKGKAHDLGAHERE